MGEINIHLATIIIDQSRSRGDVVTPSIILKKYGDILL